MMTTTMTAAEMLKRCGKIQLAAPEMFDALTEIAKGEGAFNRDPLIHAENTIESMKSIARAVLAKVAP